MDRFTYREPPLEAKIMMTRYGPARRIFGRKPEWWGYIHCSWEEQWHVPGHGPVTGTIARAMRKEYVLELVDEFRLLRKEYSQSPGQ